LSSFGISEKIPRLFADVLLLSRVDGEYSFLFNCDIKRVSKDKVGTVKKLLNFSPRLNGLLADQVPEVMKADLKEIVKLKGKV